MQIVHISAECYPVAKVGGLADVVGALPKYQTSLGHHVKVIMPMHHTPFLLNHQWQEVYENRLEFKGNSLHFKIVKEQNDTLGFELNCMFSIKDGIVVIKKGAIINDGFELQ